VALRESVHLTGFFVFFSSVDDQGHHGIALLVVAGGESDIVRKRLKRAAPRQSAVPRANRDCGFEKSGLNVEVDSELQLSSNPFTNVGDPWRTAVPSIVPRILRFDSERLFSAEAQEACL